MDSNGIPLHWWILDPNNATCLILGKIAYTAHNANESNASAGSMQASAMHLWYTFLSEQTHIICGKPLDHVHHGAMIDLLPLNSLPTRWPVLCACHSTVVLEVSSKAWHIDTCALITAGLVIGVRLDPCSLHVYLGLLLVPTCLDPCGSFLASLFETMFLMDHVCLLQQAQPWIYPWWLH